MVLFPDYTSASSEPNPHWANDIRPVVVNKCHSPSGQGSGLHGVFNLLDLSECYFHVSTLAAVPWFLAGSPRVLVNDAVRPHKLTAVLPGQLKHEQAFARTPGSSKLTLRKDVTAAEAAVSLFRWHAHPSAGSIGHLPIRHSVDGKNRIPSTHNGLGARGEPSPVEKGTRFLLSNGSMLNTWKFNQSVSPFVPPENTGTYPPPRLRADSAA